MNTNKQKNIAEMPKTAVLPFLPGPQQFLKFTHRHCPLCKPILTREHPLGKYLTFEELWWSMYYRAGAVLREFHPNDRDLEVEALKLNVTYQKNEWMFHNLGDMRDTKKRDEVMRELRQGGENITLEVKFTTRVKTEKASLGPSIGQKNF